MILKKHVTPKKTPPPSWKGVRKIYKKLSDEFHVLTKTYHVDIDATTKIYLDHLIIAIDEVDNCIDELPTKKERDAITKSLTDFLLDEKDNWNHPNATPTLSRKIENLHQVVRQLEFKDKFIDAVKSIFSHTELKRHTIEEDKLIQHVTLEGRATAILPLSVMGVKADTPFGIFFSELCMLMGIADLFFDARQDFKKDFIALKPSLSLYLKLFKITIFDGVSLLLSIPRKLQFVKYCFRFTLALMKG